MVASFREPEEIAAENPGFKFPDASVKFLDAQRAFDLKRGAVSGSAENESTYKIHRGYIRNLQPASLKYVKTFKCRFQFNPQEISQNVSMREDIYNPILLTPEQLSQPIGGTVNFQFDLLFDRSQEMAEDLDRGYVIFDQTRGAEGTDSLYDARRFGVFADLKMLYAVIGQGLTNDLIESQIANIKNFYEAKFKRDQSYTSSAEEDDEEEDSTTTTSDIEDLTGVFGDDFNVSELTNMFASNLGNSAFLIPNPVRIVFSDLFMVDGFVTGTRVDFLKFNNYMTPMQCRVAMSVNAMYIGFAKTKTFLTTSIDQATKALEEELQDSTAASKEIKQALLDIGPFILAFEASFNYTDWDRAANGDLNNPQLANFLIPASANGSEALNAYAGFKGVRPVEGEGDDIDGILALFESPNSTPFTISYEWEMKVYGERDQNSRSGQGWTQQEASTKLSNGAYLNEDEADVVALYQGSESASSPGDWGAGGSGGGAEAERIRRRTYDNLTNGGMYALNTDDYPSAISSSYYIVTWDISISVKVGSLEIVYKPSQTLTPKVRRGTEGTGYSGSITSIDYSEGLV